MKYLLLSLILIGCNATTRKKVEADIWQVKPMPSSACDEYKNYGFFRKIICEKPTQHTLCQSGDPYYYEVVNFCKGRASEMLAMKREDAVKWLDVLTKPKEK